MTLSKGYRRNLWALLLKENYDLISKEYQHVPDRFFEADFFEEGIFLSKVGDHENHFSFDGWSPEPYVQIVEDFKANIEQIKIPEGIRTGKSTYFLNKSEGYCTEEIFHIIHFIIEICGLTGPCFYQNCAVNVKEMYKKYCEKNNVPALLEDCFYDNKSFDNPDHIYKFPSFEISELTFDEKKLFCSFNWVPRSHRLALIILFNYYDLIDHGRITSPSSGLDKYLYDKENEWTQLMYVAHTWFKNHKNSTDILDRLLKLEEKFPLIIDDRSQYKNTPVEFKDILVPDPLFEARVNSLFEVITETRFTGEHFFSEKTYWPIRLGKPFLMVNSVNSLAGLRSLGYKTFAPYIDESYDLETEDSARVEMAVLELVKLKNLRQDDPAKFLELYNQILEISEYNKSFFLRRR